MSHRALDVRGRPDVVGFALVFALGAELRMRLSRSIACQTGLTPVSANTHDEVHAALARHSFAALFFELSTHTHALWRELIATRSRAPNLLGASLVGVVDTLPAAPPLEELPHDASGHVDDYLPRDYSPREFAAVFQRSRAVQTSGFVSRGVR